jgi:hypothetical protein
MKATLFVICTCAASAWFGLPNARTGTSSAETEAPVPIISPRDASPLEALAAKEARRYLYLRTGRLLPFKAENIATPGPAGAIVVARKDRALSLALTREPDVQASLRTLEADQLWLRTYLLHGAPVLLLTGGDDLATLYAVYRFAEHLGVRFYLHGDVVPDERLALKLPVLDERQMPLFRLRGIQPFHDFPEGPDWWNVDDYEAVIAQLPKLRMNFFGLHTYPENAPNAEPTVWIGLAKDAGPNGYVTASYPASYQNTRRGNWGYVARNTRDFAGGAALLFGQDTFGPEVMGGFCPQPDKPEDCNAVFNRTADMLNRAFTLARALGVKTCVGTETPLVIPQRVRERLQAEGKNPADPSVIRELYEGIFRRAAAAYPLDYYWFWTPEGWTWEGTKADQVKRTVDDLLNAIAAARQANAPFQLATCGWVLGPQEDRALFDKVLPKEVAVSCINREVGKTPVDPGFLDVRGRGKWAIPWMEDDPGLTSPQLWVGRMRRDAAAARRYGCDGLLGIHWRTRVLSPNVSALAQAAWDQTAWNPNPVEPLSGAAKTAFAPVRDFYVDWANAEFGPLAGEPIAEVLAGVDGRLPRPCDWVDGPGGIKPDPRSWDQVAPEYGFVRELEQLRPLVRGKGNRARYEYWLETFRYQRAMAQVNCTWAAFNRAMERARQASGSEQQRESARAYALAVRRQLVRQVNEVYQHLLATVSTPGELGTLANWEQHLLPGLLTKPGEELAELLGGRLPAGAALDRAYHGPMRVIVPTVRGSLTVGENLRLTIMVLAEQPPGEVWLHWRALGRGAFVPFPVRSVGRGVYAADLPSTLISGRDFEYYVEAKPRGGSTVRFPATAPGLNQTVVLMGSALPVAEP